jgi:hypothetical protein
MTTGSRDGVWSPVNLTQYKSDPNVDWYWADVNNPNASKVYKQLSTIGTDATSGVVTASKFYDATQYSYIQYVKEVSINLSDRGVVNAPITGVDVWLRWMPKEAFNKYTFNGSNKINGILTTGYNCPRESPCNSWQTESWIPSEWQFVGTRYETSFTLTVPLPPEYSEWEGMWNDLVSKPADSGTSTSTTNLRLQYVNNNFPDVWFQVLVTGHATWKPDRYNYRWIGNTDVYTQADYVDVATWKANRFYWTSDHPDVDVVTPYKVGDYFISHNDDGSVWNYRAVGYLPWNPYYGATVPDRAEADRGGILVSNRWTTFRRQRTTFGDIALFAPKRWRKWFA